MELKVRITGIRLAALLLGAVSGTVSAQTPSATLLGTVVDPSGSIVAEANVEIRNRETNETRKAQSDQGGEFTAPDLAPGFYDVTISKEGFRLLRQTNLELHLDQQARLEFKLEVGSLSQTVEVEAAPVLLNTENAAKGDVAISQELIEVPLDGRDFTDLGYLTPGVLPKPAGVPGSMMAINGARADNTNFLVDGFNNRESRTGGAQVRPNLDAMQEFKMQTTGYSAESGRLAGGVVNMALKSGTNRLRGTLFEFLRNDKLDARNFFDEEKSELRRNQFGGTISGPIVAPKIYNGRDRTFFLFSWESYRQRQGDSRLGVVPTAAERQGDFSAAGPLKDPLASGACNSTNRAACFPGNQIPLSRISSVALQAQTYFPAASRPSQVNNYYVSAHTPSDWDSQVIKIDHRLTTADALSFRYLKRYNRSENPFVGTGNGLGIFRQITRNHTMLTGLNYTRTFSPTLINEARFGISRTTAHNYGSYQGVDYNAKFGMSGGPTDPKLIGFPLFVITSYERLGDAVNQPSEFTMNDYHVSDTVTWVRGKHLVKFGGELLRDQFFAPYYNNARGTYNFTGSWTTQSYADFLLGLPNSTSRQVGTVNNYLFSNDYSLFMQDDWKVSGRLTLNLGLRYELPMLPADKYGRWTNYIPEARKLAIASDATLAGTGIGFSDPTKVATAKELGLPSSLSYTSRKNVAPRFGLAWRPFGGNRTVLRGGYGIFYGTQEYNTIRTALGAVFPFALSMTVNRVASNPQFLTLSNPFPVPPTLTNNVVNVNGIQLHAPTPYLQSWNLTLEREIGLQSAVEVGYIGSKGTHLGRQFNINQPFRSAAAAPNFPVPYTGWGTINYFGFYCNSIYNSASITFRRRFSRGFFYRASYTYSKSIDNASSLGGNSGIIYGGFQNARDFRADRGRSDWDIGHSIMTSFSWTVPWKHNVLLRGWMVSGSGIARSGPPFTPQVNNVNLNLGEANRPNRLRKGTVANPSADGWYDISSFSAVPTGAFAFGNSGRNILDGPGMVQMNASLSKTFHVRENSALQFRWEVFNIVNHPNLGMPEVNINVKNAGTITSAGDPRLMQFALRLSF